MIINEVLNYNESVQFLLSMRKTVSNVVSSSPKLTEIQQSELKSFIINEASDYEVLHLAMKGELPIEKFNLNNEFLLFSELKETLLINYESISKILDAQDLAVFMSEVGPIYPELSTANPILEMYLNILNEEKDEVKVDPHATSKRWIKTGAEKFQKFFKDRAVARGKASAPDYADRHPEHRPEPGPDPPPEPGAISKAVGHVGKAIGDVKGHVHAAVEKGKEVAGKIKDTVVGKDEPEPGGVYHKAGLIDKGHQMASSANAHLGGHGVAALAATALAGVAAYGATKIYKRFFSQAAKACNDKSGDQKTACMHQYKVKALQAKIASLSKSKETCDKAKNPEKCVSAINAEIQKAQSQAK